MLAEDTRSWSWRQSTLHVAQQAVWALACLHRCHLPSRSHKGNVEGPEGCPHTVGGTMEEEHWAWATPHFKGVRGKPAYCPRRRSASSLKLLHCKRNPEKWSGHKAMLALPSWRTQQDVCRLPGYLWKTVFPIISPHSPLLWSSPPLSPESAGGNSSKWTQTLPTTSFIASLRSVA